MATLPRCANDPGLAVPHALGLPDGGPLALIDTVKGGLPTSSFTALARLLRVSEARLAGVTGISGSTLARRKRDGKLAPPEGEHVVRIARLLERATRLFGDVEAAAEWLRSANTSLGGSTPLDLADTEIGAREVEDLLGRIEYGVYS